MDKILVVEDDDNLRLTLVDNLELEGYEVQAVGSIVDAQKMLGKADLCLLDIMLPDGDGYRFCEWARSQRPDVLILMLTARTMERDLDMGFEAGADDYLGKPYRMKELLLRIKALLRRRASHVHVEDKVSINGHTICWSAREVSTRDELIHLTKKEFDILQFLYTHLGVVQSRNDILDAVWGRSTYIDTRTIDNFVANLKKHLDLKEGNEYFIRSVRGVGYCLQKTTEQTG